MVLSVMVVVEGSQLGRSVRMLDSQCSSYFLLSDFQPVVLTLTDGLLQVLVQM